MPEKVNSTDYMPQITIIVQMTWFFVGYTNNIMDTSVKSARSEMHSLFKPQRGTV